MNIFKYLIIKIIILVVVIVLFWNGAHYLVPDEVLNTKFGFLDEGAMFIRLSVVFVVLFMAFLIYEINKFHKTSQLKLRNTAIIFIATLLLMSVPLFYYYFKY
ncbi:hypothetical protein [Flavobacterium tegetincola]|uniref:hypothetical protein n=1 Tax=Flavobacterium tegetincola TaxID=150172 RepID=UPI000479EF76|nr:hypothetical protein [Flavobacterium tegetincola]